MLERLFTAPEADTVMAGAPLDVWARRRAARTWDVLVIAEGPTPIGTLTPAFCAALARQLPGVPVAVVERLEHLPIGVYTALGGPPPEAIIGEVVTAEHVAGLGVRAMVQLAPRGQGLHDVLLVLFAAGALRSGPSIVCARSSAQSAPDAIHTDPGQVLAVDIVWCPGGGGRFWAPMSHPRADGPTSPGQGVARDERSRGGVMGHVRA